MSWIRRFVWLGAALLVATLALQAQTTNLWTIGGLEGTTPSFWNIGSQPGGATLTWATDQYQSMGHSLKITKSVTSDSAAWVSDNMCDIWSPQIGKNVDILLGAYVKTSGVNTSPTTDDQKWYVAYTFYDSAGALIGKTKLPIDQSVATSSGWIADTNQVGETILPKDAWKLIVSFVGGKNATGTVWADDFILLGREGAWAGQDWNTGVGVPTGWYYWLPPIGGNDGALADGFENTVVTSEAAHSGMYSLKFVMPAGRDPHDGFVGTKRYTFGSSAPSGKIATRSTSAFHDIASLQDVKPGDMLRLSVWIKASDLVPDSAALYPGTWSVGFTPLWFEKAGNNDGYSPVGPANDYTFTFPSVTSFDWTQYTLDVQVPTDVGATALEIRLHVYSRFVGTVYFDDLTVQKVGTTTSAGLTKDGVPRVFELSNNYPNPFNPSTRIEFSVPREGTISLVIYNMLGQRLRVLAQGSYVPGHYTVTWDGRDEVGRTVGSGVYFYRLETGSTALVKKMLLLK